MSSATRSSGLAVWTPASRTGSSWSEESFFSWMRMWAASSLGHHLLAAGDEIGREVALVGLDPLDDVESSVSAVLASSTVITPSLPTFFVASAMILPIALSPLAEIVPTWAI
jgi:hypothetical protein